MDPRPAAVTTAPPTPPGEPAVLPGDFRQVLRSPAARTAAVRWIALIVLTAIVFYLCWMVIQPFINVLLWSTVLSIVAYPLYLRLRRTGNGRTLAAGLTTAAVVLAVVVPAVVLGIVLFNWATDAAPDFEASARQLIQPDSAPVKFVGRFIDIDRFVEPAYVADQLRSLRSATASWIVGTIGNVISGAIQTLLVVLTVFYMIRDADNLLPAVRKFMPMDDARAGMLLSRMYEVLSASLLGVLLIALIQALLGGVALWVLGVPATPLWSIVMFVAAVIPMLGAGVVWVPAAIYLAATGAWIKAIILVAWGSVVVGLADNVLRPILVGKRARLHELVIFFSVLGGLKVFGILGLIIGPVLAAVAESLIYLVGLASAASTPSTEERPGVAAGPGDAAGPVPPPAQGPLTTIAPLSPAPTSPGATP